MQDIKEVKDEKKSKGPLCFFEEMNGGNETKKIGRIGLSISYCSIG